MRYLDIIDRISGKGERIIRANSRTDNVITEKDILFWDDYAGIDDLFDPIYYFPIVDTMKLVEIADKARKEKGYKPMFGDDNDEDGWYNFEITFDRDSKDLHIDFLVEDSEDKDDNCYWVIELGDDEKSHILSRLEEEFKK